jgi:hypothetical protein
LHNNVTLLITMTLAGFTNNEFTQLRQTTQIDSISIITVSLWLSDFHDADAQLVGEMALVYVRIVDLHDALSAAGWRAEAAAAIGDNDDDDDDDDDAGDDDGNKEDCDNDDGVAIVNDDTAGDNVGGKVKTNTFVFARGAQQARVHCQTARAVMRDRWRVALKRNLANRVKRRRDDAVRMLGASADAAYWRLRSEHACDAGTFASALVFCCFTRLLITLCVSLPHCIAYAILILTTASQSDVLFVAVGNTEKMDMSAWRDFAGDVLEKLDADYGEYMPVLRDAGVHATPHDITIPRLAQAFRNDMRKYFAKQAVIDKTSR